MKLHSHLMPTRMHPSNKIGEKKKRSKALPSSLLFQEISSIPSRPLKPLDYFSFLELRCMYVYIESRRGGPNTTMPEGYTGEGKIMQGPTRDGINQAITAVGGLAAPRLRTPPLRPSSRERWELLGLARVYL